MMPVMFGGNTPVHTVVTSPYFRADHTEKSQGSHRTQAEKDAALALKPAGWLTQAEAAEIAGVFVDQIKVARRTKHLPSIKPDHAVYIDPVELAAWIAAGTPGIRRVI